MKKQTNLFILCPLIIVALIINSNFLCFAASDQVAINGNLVWEKTFGGTGDDRAFYAVKTIDGFLLVGSTKSVIENTAVAFVVKIDDDGNQVWNKTYPYDGGNEFRYIINLSDGFLLVGNAFSSNGDANGFVLKIDTQGKALWNLTLGGATIDRLFSGAKAQDGFLLAGLSESTGDSNVWLTKIDVNGQVIWNKTYGWLMDEAARAAIPTKDNGFLIAGYTNSIRQGDYDFLVLKIDNSGNLIWNQTYGGTESDKAYSISQDEEGFVLVGDTRSEGAGDSDALVVKIDLQGNSLWKQTFGGSGFDVPTLVSRLTNGEGYLVGGTTFSFGNGYREFWLFTFNNSGKLLQSCTIGRSNYEEAYATIQVSNDKFVMAGWTNSIGQGHYDFYVVKVQFLDNNQWWQNYLFIIVILGIISFFVIGLVLIKWRVNRKKRLK